MRRFNMMHIQNASLAGGVAMGAASNLYLTIGGAHYIAIKGSDVYLPCSESTCTIPLAAASSAT